MREIDIYCNNQGVGPRSRCG